MTEKVKGKNKIFLSAVTGNILEYYDFTVYTVFLKQISEVFFPAGDPHANMLATLAIFAVGFATRPLGGILFGYIGDKFGRKRSLIISILGMTLPTFAIGLIPGYDSIGLMAPMMLVLCRLLQGLCISGEGAGAAIFVLEHFHNLRPGLVTGLVHGSNIAGTLIAAVVGIIIDRYFFHINFAWRFAFLLGGAMGLVGFYLRLQVSETPIFKMLTEKHKTLKAPFLHVVRTAWPMMLLTFCVAASTSSIVYLVKTYLNVLYSTILPLQGDCNVQAKFYLSYASVVLMLSMPLAGAIADIIGKARMMIYSASTIIIFAVPVLYGMCSSNEFERIIAITILAMLAGSVSGTAYIFVISLFTPEQRFTGVAFSYNLGIAIFGGTSPMISKWLVEKTGLFFAPAFYIIVTALIFLTAMYVIYDPSKKPRSMK